MSSSGVVGVWGVMIFVVLVMRAVEGVLWVLCEFGPAFIGCAMCTQFQF